jgi:NAD(P)-dependent dehydrogenase (short-subunit alcohol dehydrogenase family)
VAAIESAGGTARAFKADIADSTERQQLIEQVTAALGPIDILVNNAAVTYFLPFTDFTRKRLDVMWEVQFVAPFELSQLVVPSMYERGAGWILNISSRAAEHAVGPPYPKIYDFGWTVYGPCKAALERLTTALAAEGHKAGLRVNSLAPKANVATPGAGDHNLVEGFELEDVSLMAEAALALVEGDLTGRNVLSQDLLEELDRSAAPISEALK